MSAIPLEYTFSEAALGPLLIGLVTNAVNAEAMMRFLLAGAPTVPIGDEQRDEILRASLEAVLSRFPPGPGQDEIREFYQLAVGHGGK